MDEAKIRELGEKALKKEQEKAAKKEAFRPVAAALWSAVLEILSQDGRARVERVSVPGHEYPFASVDYSPPGSFTHSGEPEWDNYSVRIVGVFTWQARIIGEAMRANPPVLGRTRLSLKGKGKRHVSAGTMDMRGYSYPSFSS